MSESYDPTTDPAVYEHLLTIARVTHVHPVERTLRKDFPIMTLDELLNNAENILTWSNTEQSVPVLEPPTDGNDTLMENVRIIPGHVTPFKVLTKMIECIMMEEDFMTFDWLGLTRGDFFQYRGCTLHINPTPPMPSLPGCTQSPNPETNAPTSTSDTLKNVLRRVSRET